VRLSPIPEGIYLEVWNFDNSLFSSLSARSSGEGLELESLGLAFFAGTQKTSSSTYLFLSSDGEVGGLPASAIVDEIFERIFLNIFCVSPMAGRGIRFG
jgi:hypothetical protein